MNDRQQTSLMGHEAVCTVKYSLTTRSIVLSPPYSLNVFSLSSATEPLEQFLIPQETPTYENVHRPGQAASEEQSGITDKLLSK